VSHHKEELRHAIEKFEAEYMHGCPVAQSTLPGFMDPRNELILALFRFWHFEGDL
jgi:hypothetical protein